MGRVDSRLTRLERRTPGRPARIIMAWSDDETVTDDNGDEVTVAEWRRRHPEALTIQMTWGDEIETD